MSHISALWSTTTNIRNICILAHVDHGKTTLTDYLLASNSIISSRQAGHARYMDSRSDEQERGITMKSSAVALKYTDATSQSADVTGADTAAQTNGSAADAVVNKDYIVHVIDSPGHIDFSSEVSHAIRLCDGAVVLVDVLEGVQVQTIAVLEQCWAEKLIPILCLTKLDRLLHEVKMSSSDAYVHIRKLLEQLNAVTSTFITRDAMQQHAAQIEARLRRNSATTGDLNDLDEQYVDYEETSRFEFLPEKGNVMFASALDGWAFTIPQFAQMFAVKLGCSANALQRALFGDYYYNSKTKSVSTKPNKANKVMFVQMILDNIWQLYDTVHGDDDERISTIVQKLNIQVPPRELASKDSRVKLQSILSRWLPLSRCVLSSVVRHIPPPATAQQTRMADMWPYISSQPNSTIVTDTLSCNSASQHVVLYISKMIDLGKKSSGAATAAAADIVRRTYQKGKFVGDSSTVADGSADNSAVTTDTADEDDDSNNLVAFARVYCGTLKRNSNQQIHVIGPKFNVNNSLDKERALGHIHSISTSTLQLYMLMATDTFPVDNIPAGNVCGIGGLSKYVLKHATLCTEIVPSFRDMKYQTQPIVRVAIEPVNASDIKALNKGLKLLNLADSNVTVGVQETGESVIVAAGELHLERCIRDLKDRYAPNVPLRISPPIVPFRETIVLSDSSNTAEPEQHTDKAKVAVKRSHGKRADKHGDDSDTDTYDAATDATEKVSNIHRDTTPNRACTISVQALPLPDTVIELLEASQHLLKRMMDMQQQAVKRKQHHTTKHATNDVHNTNGIHNGTDAIAADEPASAERTAMLQQIEQQTRRMQLTGDAGDTDDTVSMVSESTVASTSVHTQNGNDGVDKSDTDIQAFLEQLRTELSTATHLPSDLVDKMWCFGPKKICTNILVNNVPDLHALTSITSALSNTASAQHVITADEATNSTHAERVLLFESIQSGLLNGFQLASQAGPLCDEPLSGVVFIIEAIEVQLYDTQTSAYGSMSGQVMSTFKDMCRTCLHNQRLIEPIYRVDLQCTADQLGSLYNVLTRRRGKIVKDELLEGTSLFMVNANLPVTESFGFANDIRTKTGGAANPQLVFSHWQRVEIDPYWVPVTEEEIEEHGVAGLSEAERANTNLARRLVDGVRRRKGLATRQKVVESGSKQRTLNRKK